MRLTPTAPDQVPHLSSKLRDKNWVFLWDARREAGYLLVVPPLQGRDFIRFEVQWEKPVIP